MQLPARIGKYELQEFLGGGMSHVYRAADTVLGRPVAVKILTDEGCRDAEAKARFLTEARIGSSIAHPNVISIYDFGEEQGRPFMVMELLRGENLRTAIREGHTGSPAGRLKIALQLARGLEAIHAHKITHRDIKPENVHISSTGTVKLVDFGIAKTEGLSLTRVGFVLGTPYYMAPEQVLGQEITPRSDVYAFGILLYELMTGVRATAGDSLERIFYAILNEPLNLEPLRRIEAPEGVCDLVAQCTAKRPEERIQNFTLIAERIEKLMNPVVPESARTISESEPSVPSPVFGSWADWLLPVLTAICVIGLLAAVYVSRHDAAGLLAVALVAGGALLPIVLLRRRHNDGFRERRRAATHSPTAQPPPVQPVAPTPPITFPDAGAVRSPHTRTSMFDTAVPPGRAPSLPLPAPPSAPRQASPVPSPPRLPGAAPGEFTNLFGNPALPEPPASAPGEFTRIFGSPAAPSPPTPARPVSTPPGEFTQMFQTTPPPPPSSASAPPAAPAGPTSAPEKASESTQIFSVPRPAKEPSVPGSEPVLIPDVALTITNCSDLASKGKRYKVDHFPFRIGKSEADLALAFDPAISRQHAQVDFAGGGFTILDLGSANGTFVNGVRLAAGQSEPLLYGATILLGSNTLLTFVSNELEELPDLTGTRIGGRYTLSAKLYASAKSALYSASDERLPQSVVVKVLSPRLARHPGYREQFDHEAKLACKLKHPNISRVLDYGETDLGAAASGRSLYLCMEHFDGGSLAKRIAGAETFDLERVAGWLEKLAQGLDYIHAEEVIHGGIKPSAILFDSADNPYLTDFAIAVTAGGKAQRSLIGSPAFLAPEQWESGALLPATDQYSFAVMFYLVLTGSHPHEGQEHPEVRKRNFQRGPVPAHEMAAQNQRPPVPAAVSAVLKRAMATNPGDRFATATEFARSFRRALTQTESSGPRRPLIFISYQRATGSAWALLFKNELEREYGCDVFVDTEQRDKAGQFPKKLERSIQRCDVFVCLLSDNTLESPWVCREIRAAFDARKPMVPVIQESFVFPKDLSALPPETQELLQSDGPKLFDRQNVYVPAAIQLLSEAIRQSIGGEGRAQAGSG